MPGHESREAPRPWTKRLRRRRILRYRHAVRRVRRCIPRGSLRKWPSLSFHPPTRPPIHSHSKMILEGGQTLGERPRDAFRPGQGSGFECSGLNGPGVRVFETSTGNQPRHAHGPGGHRRPWSGEIEPICRLCAGERRRRLCRGLTSKREQGNWGWVQSQDLLIHTLLS